jgi:hypothetical protein
MIKHSERIGLPGAAPVIGSVAATLNAPLRPPPSPMSQADQRWQGMLARIRRLEDQTNAFAIVFDVGFICSSTRCRSGSVRMVATSGGYRLTSVQFQSLIGY